MIGKKLGSAIGRRGVLGGALGLGAGAAIGSGRPYVVGSPQQPVPPSISGYSSSGGSIGPHPQQAPEAVRALWKRREEVTRAYLNRPRIAGLDLDLAARRGVSPTWICLQQSARDRRHVSIVDKLRDEAHSLLEAAQKGVGAMLGIGR